VRPFAQLSDTVFVRIRFVPEHFVFGGVLFDDVNEHAAELPVGLLSVEQELEREFESHPSSGRVPAWNRQTVDRVPFAFLQRLFFASVTWVTFHCAENVPEVPDVWLRRG
jgi:hypothetical protein